MKYTLGGIGLMMLLLSMASAYVCDSPNGAVMFAIGLGCIGLSYYWIRTDAEEGTR